MTEPANTPYESKNGIILCGEMGQFISSFNWSKTALGAVTQWPLLLKSTVNSVLLSPLASVILWGTDGIMIYNDGYAKIAGARHPTIFG